MHTSGYTLFAQIPLDVTATLPFTSELLSGTATFRLGGVFNANGVLDAPAPGLIEVRRQAGGTRVRWREVISGAHYRAQFNDDLIRNWQDFTGTLSADGDGVIEIFDPSMPAPARRFYRLVTPP